jgi:hypothetical protein
MRCPYAHSATLRAMGQRVRPEERFAEEVLRRVLGIEVTGRDDGSSDRMADVLFTLPNGAEGALEVTTIGEQAALESAAIAAKMNWHVNGATWAWAINIGHDVAMRDLKRHLPTLVLTSERLGLSDPRLVPCEHQQDDAFRWFRSSNLSMHGFPGPQRPGAIHVLPEGDGGAVYEHLDELPQWLAGRLRQLDLMDNIDKLTATGRAELHLFVRIHDTGMPFSLYYPLASGNYVPCCPLDAPAGLAGLWLAPAWDNPILWWSRSQGWARADCLD